ncbi:hypothetical protein BCD67_24885 [Oscillatoriales cyanobacterium USR001]|nr:hypothetical protein BCD67_24885 [Oscillatoriales cyanobacterium USR001]
MLSLLGIIFLFCLYICISSYLLMIQDEDISVIAQLRQVLTLLLEIVSYAALVDAFLFLALLDWHSFMICYGILLCAAKFYKKLFKVFFIVGIFLFLPLYFAAHWHVICISEPSYFHRRC